MNKHIYPTLKTTFKIKGYLVDEIVHYKHDGEVWAYMFKITRPDGVFTHWRHLSSNLNELKKDIKYDIKNNEIEYYGQTKQKCPECGSLFILDEFGELFCPRCKKHTYLEE